MGEVRELWEKGGASVEYSSPSFGFKEDWGVRETVSWLEVELVSFFRRTARPAANKSNMMRKRKIRMIGLTAFADFPSPFS